MKRSHLFALVPILLAGYLLRVYRLGAQNIWWDEGLAIWAVRKSFVGTTLWTAGDVHPPLYFWLLWPWTRLAGYSEFAARYITLVYGMLTVALAYPLGKRLAGRPVGLLAALLLALARFEVWWSQEMRMYMLAGLMGMMGTYWLVQLVDGRDRGLETGYWILGIGYWGLWAFYVLSMAAALYTIYLSIVFVVVHDVWVLGVLVWGRLRNRWAFLRRWLVAQAVIAGLMLPWLALALPRMNSWRVIEEPPKLSFVTQLYATLLATGISTNLDNARLPTTTITAIAILGTLYARRNTQYPTPNTPLTIDNSRLTINNWLPLLFTLIPPLLVWLITQPRSIFYSPRVEARYLLPFAAPVYVLLARSIRGLWRRWRPAGAGALAVVLVIFLWTLPTHYRDRYLRDDLQSMTRVIRAYAQPGDAVALVSGNRYPVFLYYYDRTFENTPARPPVYQLPAGAPRLTEENVETELAPIAAQHKRVWLAWVNGPLQDPAGLAEARLNDHRTRTLSLGFAHNALHLYADSEGEPTVPDAPWMAGLNLDLGDAHALGYDLTTKEFRPGDLIRLGLYARTSEPATLAVRWVPDGHPALARQTLELPATAGAVIRRRVEFAVSEAVPQGSYHFDLGGPDTAFGKLVVNRTRGPARDAQPDHVMNSRIGGNVQFLGYRLRDARGNQVQALKPGQTIYLDLFWRTATPIDRRLTVFAHLLGTTYNPATGGPVWAGHDSEPLMGAIPTTQWPADTVIVDRHPLTLDTAAPAGEYQIELGLYDTATGERLPVAGDGADEGGRRILIGSVLAE